MAKVIQQTTGYTTELAIVVIKTDKIGNSIELKPVTPAQLMFLVADNAVNAGEDPVKSLTIIPDDSEEEKINELQAKVEELTELYNKANNDETITPEIQERRLSSFQRRIDSARDGIARLQAQRNLRFITPSEEKERLISRYGGMKISKIFPGEIPQLPKSFEEARKVGLKTKVPVTRLIGNDEPQS